MALTQAAGLMYHLRAGVSGYIAHLQLFKVETGLPCFKSSFGISE